MIYLLQLSENRGRAVVDPDGSIWWDPQNGKPRELLTDKDSLCGIFPFETGVDDALRDACSVHDHFYGNRMQYNLWGFDRKWMDDMFYGYMNNIADNNKMLQDRAWEYYLIVRTIGWVPYNKHPGLMIQKRMESCTTERSNEPKQSEDVCLDVKLVDADLIKRFDELMDLQFIRNTFKKQAKERSWAHGRNS